MPNPIKAALCADDYTSACTIQSVYHGNGGSYNVTGQAVFYQVQYSTDANAGDETWTDEIYLNPGAGSIDKGAIGVRFRNAVAGSQATVSAYINPPGRPGLNISSSAAASGAQNLVPTPLASFPPSSPSDGDLVVIELPATYDPVGGKKIRWIFSYNTAESCWDSIGNPPLYAEVQTQENNANAAYGDLATIGPAITLPRAGDYIIGNGFELQSNAGNYGYMAYAGAGITAADADAATATDSGIVSPVTGYREREKTGLTAATITAKYKQGNNSVFMGKRWLRITPIRIT